MAIRRKLTRTAAEWREFDSFTVEIPVEVMVY